MVARHIVAGCEQEGLDKNEVGAFKYMIQNWTKNVKSVQFLNFIEIWCKNLI